MSEIIVITIVLIVFGLSIWAISWVISTHKQRVKLKNNEDRLNTLFPGTWKYAYDLAKNAPSFVMARSILYYMQELPENEFPPISLEAVQEFTRVCEAEGEGPFYYLQKYICKENPQPLKKFKRHEGKSSKN